MFGRILVANRGEIAVRVIRTCRELGVATVAVHSDVDAGARHVRLADESVHLPGVSATETYLNLDAVVAAARSTGAEAVHPGYGFFSESADAAEAVEAAGLVWIGPPPEATRASGDKVRARKLAESAGVSVVPGTLEPISDVGEVHAFGERHGYPIAIKAAGGGGGRGLKVAPDPQHVESALESAAREARMYFGQADVYLERYLERPKHVEVQVISAGPGRAIWLGARDCSLQRRHQKLVEETPPPLHRGIVPAMGEAAVAVADAAGYVNAGTVEFLVDEDGSFYFLEVNARLQVEHTITEEVLGVDLVACQLRVAAGDQLGFAQGDLAPRGHAIECRINAENPAKRFLPGPGTITRYREPGGIGVRVDSGYGEGDEVPRAYDSLIAKLIVRAPTREEARRRMLRALEEYEIEGVPTTIPAHRLLLEEPSFVDGSYTTRTAESGLLDALKAAPAPGGASAPSSSIAVVVNGQAAHLWSPAMSAGSPGAAASGGGSGGAVVAPMQGTILQVLVAKGDSVRPGDPVAVLEAMKMETSLASSAEGTISSIEVEPGQTVESGQTVATIE
jgi:acetyl-CoA/propionyl-CoA carboxylase biotin carboxyl carrier protein